MRVIFLYQAKKKRLEHNLLEVICLILQFTSCKITTAHIARVVAETIYCAALVHDADEGKLGYAHV